MSKIFIGQTKLIIQLSTSSDLVGCQNAQIRYEKPNGQRGSFPASIMQVTPGVIQYEVVSAADFDVAGVWKIWAHVTFTDNKVSIGEVANVQVLRPGDK